MKRSLFILIFSICIFISSSLFSQNGTIVYNSFYSPSLSQNIPLAIYLPPNHSPAAEPYRTYIFLHGGGGSTYTAHLGAISSALNSLINDTTINFEPIVVICPSITWQGLGGGLNWYNMHWYVDSYLTGNYESVIATDLYTFMDTCSYNLSNAREKRAIGGFSMGGACIPISIRHCQKFIAFTSHCGPASVEYWKTERQYVLNECPPPKPPYQFDPGNGVWTLTWFSFSAIFSPDTVSPNQPNWQVDFPIDSESGELIAATFDSLWKTKYDPKTLILNSICADSVHMYFDTRNGDLNRPYNNLLHLELDTLGIQHIYKLFNSGGHQYSSDQAVSGFMFLDSIMDSYVTDIELKKDLIANKIELYQNYPNPFNPKTTIEFSIPKSEFVELKIYDIRGKIIQTLVSDNMSAGIYQYEWNSVGTVASGIYYYVIKAGQFIDTKKLVLLK